MIRIKFERYGDGFEWDRPPKTHFCTSWPIAGQVMADLANRYPAYYPGVVAEEYSHLADDPRDGDYHHDPGGSVILTEPVLVCTAVSPSISVYCGDVKWAQGAVETKTRWGASYRKVYSRHHVLVLPAEDADAYLRWLIAVEPEARAAFYHFIARRKDEREDRGIG